MSLTNPAFSTSSTNTRPLATSAAAAPGLLQQVGMAGGAAVITVTFIHPIDVVKVRLTFAVPLSIYLAFGRSVFWKVLRECLKEARTQIANDPRSHKESPSGYLRQQCKFDSIFRLQRKH